MDILDIDEALKDDSFIFLEDKTHDDVSNILQQWKTNNQEQAFKLNTRTFTRPKRKFAQNLEALFGNSNSSHHQNATQHLQTQQQQQQHQQNYINMDIGGLVTTMQKSYLQDTSPPSSICSSMDASSMDRMNASLITSADFTNVSFLQSTRGLEFDDSTAGSEAAAAAAAAAAVGFYFNEKSAGDSYTLNDMIRDRKALENLTLSGEGTLIKDSNIAQIDDISLMSKTESGCSTMDNSTESMDTTPVANRTCNLISGEILKTFNRTFEKYTPSTTIPLQQQQEEGNCGTTSITDDMIGNTTFSLVESSIGMESSIQQGQHSLNITDECLTKTIQQQYKLPNGANNTFCQQNAPNNLNDLDATICLSKQFNEDSIKNTTFDCNNDSPKCGTPENVQSATTCSKFLEQSTPQQTEFGFRCKQRYTPSIKGTKMNLSPIIGTPNATTIIDESFEKSFTSNQIKSETFCEINKNDSMPFDDMEMLENIENPNDMFSHTSIVPTAQTYFVDQQQQQQQQEVNILLESNDKNEEEFNQMLERISRIEINEEQIKMRKSLDTIKKRFTVGGITTNEHKTSPPQPIITEGKEVANGGYFQTQSNGDFSMHSSANAGASGASSGNNSGAGDRLLNRRSRLYDDVNLSISAKSTSASFIVQQPTVLQTQQQRLNHMRDDHADIKTEISCENETKSNTSSSPNNQKTEEQCNGKNSSKDYENTEETSSNVAAGSLRPTLRATKLEKRGDRDRFKTIRIVKRYDELSNGGAPAREFNVPCIDDDDCENADNEAILTTTTQSSEIEEPVRMSRRDNNLSPSPPASQPAQVFNNNNNNNYATYRKPKEKLFRRNEIPSARAVSSTSISVAAPQPPQQAPPPSQHQNGRERSLSRPRYISGLQKFSVANKAISAGDLEQTITQPQITSGATFNRSHDKPTTQKLVKDLKSPMGIKSKSFHNLASNFGYSVQPPTYTGKSIGLKKSSTAGGNVCTDKVNKMNPNRTNQMSRMHQMSSSKQQQNNEDAVFKVPNVISGLRAPSTTNAKRTGLMRPSSGYYSLSIAKVPAEAADSDNGRHSPTDSMSSASSRGSISGLKTVIGNDMNSGKSITSSDKNTNVTNGGISVPEISNMNTTKIISKPSGLKLPSNIKRSGLPRPASIVRR